MVAPFIREFALAGQAPETQLIECQQCGFRFFDRRYEAEEMRALYSQYRSENYFQARNRHEFWYTRAINDQLGKDPKDIAARRAYVEKFLSEAFGEQKFSSILDYGGDAGQFIPDEIARRKFVHVERYRPLRLLNEIYTLYFRTRWNMIPPFGFPRLHEHINFYSVDSIGRLLKRCGFDVVRQQIIRTDTKLGRTESLLMLARRAGAAP